MFAFLRRRQWRRIILAAAGIFLLVVCAAVWFLNPRLTAYVESDAFRKAIAEETAKGLHLQTGDYKPLRRTGFLTASTNGFQGAKGKKAIHNIDAKGITAVFNPWAIFIRRWQVDDIRIDSGKVEIATYEPKPEPKPPKPWYMIFLPDRFYMKRVVADPADVTWQLRDKPAGFFGTRLMITPHGRDFDYWANGGKMRMALIPELKLQGIHLLITKKLLTLYNFDLATGEDGAGSIHVRGTAGVGEDKSVDAHGEFTGVAVSEWLPESWKNRFHGTASGEIHWKGKNTKLETSSGTGALRIRHAKVEHLPLLEQLASLSGKKSLLALELDECALEVEWDYPKIALKKLALSAPGIFRLEGSLTVQKRALDGTFRLGVTREYLAWLPVADAVFKSGPGDYLWTTFHITGTLEKPKEDLTPRIKDALKEDPGAAVELFFRGIGGWFDRTFGGQ